MADTDQTVVPTPGPDDVDLRATVGLSPSTPLPPLGASGSATETRDMD